MSTFGERLKDLLFDNQKTIKQLSQDIGVSLAAVYEWQSYGVQISYKHLITVADYFYCSIDFLLGITENDTKITPKPVPPFYENLRKVMKERGITIYKLEKTTKFKNSHLNKWKNGGAPHSPTLIELAAILNCTIDYLVGRE